MNATTVCTRLCCMVSFSFSFSRGRCLGAWEHDHLSVGGRRRRPCVHGWDADHGELSRRRRGVSSSQWLTSDKWHIRYSSVSPFLFLFVGTVMVKYYILG